MCPKDELVALAFVLLSVACAGTEEEAVTMLEGTPEETLELERKYRNDAAWLKSRLTKTCYEIVQSNPKEVRDVRRFPV